ncbi:MAG: hypothetical protein UDJ85_05295 [Clostridia bacterium]|nr:hypothetical protein [Clostridia bacterium]
MYEIDGISDCGRSAAGSRSRHDLSKHSLVLELTGTPSKINGFMDVMEEYNITDVCRTGITGIEGLNRGEDDSAQK